MERLRKEWLVTDYHRHNIHYRPTTTGRLLMDQLVPHSYLQLEDTIHKIAHQYHINQKPPVLSAQEFRREVFKDPNVRISKDINDKELEQAIRFLHDNGTMLHYEDTVLNDFFVGPSVVL
ncbi:leucine-rich repeat serine/threonine-protein kinase 1-like [Dysidea avara]|uniref:leucine-rich repeat serine/threonine-protein kinase 1-like n=1 Tax=Dysidea avara TaxID=196820 RepID=UPI0033256F94